MTTKLENLLTQIALKNMHDQIAASVNHAINAFKLQSNIIDSMSDFQKIGARYYFCLESDVLELSHRQPDFEMDWGRFYNQLVKIYGANAEKAAFEIIRTGKEGGLSAVLKAVGEKMVDEYSNSMIKSKVYHFWDSLTVNEKFSVISEYIEKFGHILPEEIVENGAPRMAANFTRVLEEHPRMMKRVRDITRGY